MQSKKSLLLNIRILEEDRLPFFKGNDLEMHDLGLLIQTREGPSAVREAIEFLKYTFRLSSLRTLNDYLKDSHI